MRNVKVTTRTPNNVPVQTIALVIVGICFLIIVIFIIVVVAACHHCRKRELDHWKRYGRLLRWLCGDWRSDDQDAVTERQRRRHETSGLQSENADLFSREVIPLRSSEIVDNPVYFSPTESRVNTTGDY